VKRQLKATGPSYLLQSFYSSAVKRVQPLVKKFHVEYVNGVKAFHKREEGCPKAEEHG
jgi:hypothetical protein